MSLSDVSVSRPVPKTVPIVLELSTDYALVLATGQPGDPGFDRRLKDVQTAILTFMNISEESETTNEEAK